MLEGAVPWPQELADGYEREGVWAGTALGALPARWAEERGEREAVVGPGGRLSYAELAQRCDALARGLAAHGIGPGDRIVVQLGNEEAFIVLCFALFQLGAMPVFALPPHREHEIGYLVSHSEAVGFAVPGVDQRYDYLALAHRIAAESPTLEHLIVSGGEAAEGVTRIEDLIARGARSEPVSTDAPDPREVALFLLSGGTTGLPKLIPRTHDDYLFNASRSAEVCAVTEDSVYLVALPISHNFPLGCPGLLGTLLAGGRVVVTPSPDPKTAMPLIEAEGVTHTALVPALALRWMDYEEVGAHDISSLELLQVGGAKLNPAAARRVEPELGVRLQQVFGMAEGLLNYTRPDDPADVIEQTQGRPMSDWDEIRIVDAEGEDVAEGERGELLTRGPYTIRGYYRAEEHNRRAFTPDGYYRTGDVVRLDPSGNLVVEGREKDLINRGGEKISAEEIEDLVLSHPAVFNVAAVAMPDPVLGERTCVFVVPKRGETIDLPALREFLADRGVAKFKWPERLERVDQLPLTNVGKVSKKELRDQIAAKLESETGSPSER